MHDSCFLFYPVRKLTVRFSSVQSQHLGDVKNSNKKYNKEEKKPLDGLNSRKSIEWNRIRDVDINRIT